MNGSSSRLKLTGLIAGVGLTAATSTWADRSNSGNRGCPCSASRELRRHRVGADQHSARVADDNPRLGLVLRRIGPQEERALHTDAVLLPGLPYHDAMGAVRL